MSGCTRREEEQRIFLAYGVGIFYLMEQTGAVRELSFELGSHLFADLEAATLNPRTNSGFHISRPAAETAHHFANSFFHDALDRPAPSRVKNSNYMALRIDHHHGQAIRGLNGQKQAWGRGDQSVADKQFFVFCIASRIDAPND